MDVAIASRRIRPLRQFNHAATGLPRTLATTQELVPHHPDEVCSKPHELRGAVPGLLGVPKTQRVGQGEEGRRQGDHPKHP